MIPKKNSLLLVWQRRKNKISKEMSGKLEKILSRL